MISPSESWARAFYRTYRRDCPKRAAGIPGRLIVTHPPLGQTATSLSRAGQSPSRRARGWRSRAIASAAQKRNQFSEVMPGVFGEISGMFNSFESDLFDSFGSPKVYPVRSVGSPKVYPCWSVGNFSQLEKGVGSSSSSGRLR